VIRIGTRGSALALTQATLVGGQLGEHQIVVITTSGDRDEARNDKSRWTSALERALLDGEIDIAVHSAKDVPGELRSLRSPHAQARLTLYVASPISRQSRPARAWVRAASGELLRSARCATTWRSLSCVAMSTRGFASLRTARSTRSCWLRPD
jgi:hypothetical protein